MDNDLTNAETITLDEAACLLQFADPTVVWYTLSQRICNPMVHRALVDIVKAIDECALRTVDLPEEVIEKRGARTLVCLHSALPGPTNGSPLPETEHERREGLASLGIKREDLTRFAKTRGYLAPTLLGGTPSNEGQVDAAYASHIQDHKAKKLARNIAVNYKKKGWPDSKEGAISRILEQVSKISRTGRYKDQPYTRATIIKWIADLVPESYHRKPGRPRKLS